MDEFVISETLTNGLLTGHRIVARNKVVAPDPGRCYFWPVMNARFSYYTLLDSPVGKLLLTATPRGLGGLWILGGKHCPAIQGEWQNDPRPFATATVQLAEYFAGTRLSFDLPLDAIGTGFQHEAWTALLGIPHGQTRTYQQQAVAIGRPAAVRAVGTANGRNPISIIVPCHRVIGANGALTGFGGGLGAKQWLLAHEARYSQSVLELE